eukprot:scaffold3670_cov124-Cylindrotheca_fusiformis.AAC.13
MNNDEKDDDSGLMRPSTSIRLDEVQESTPAESEEEKIVMKSLERSNATGTSARFFDAATSIPEELASRMSTEMESSADPDAMTHKRTDTLFDLTNSINLLHMEMQHTTVPSDTSVRDEHAKVETVPVPAKIFNEPKDKDSTAEHFAANAGKLYERFNFINRKRSKGDSRKKPFRSGSSDIENRTDSGRGMSSKALKNKVVHRSLESLHEFQYLVVSRKGYVLTYARDSFFFIVLPATILAAV